MKQLKKLTKKSGFTLIEVTLFLALSSAMMLGIILATNLSVARQRYNDSVNNFADFLRGIYSKVIDVEHNQEGNTGEAVYGKFVTFREKGQEASKTIRTYDVVGKIVNSASGISASDALTVLSNDVDARFRPNPDPDMVSLGEAFYFEEHTVPWEAVLEKANNSSGIAQNCPTDADATNNCFTGAILIVRSPVSGNVKTYYSTARFDRSTKGSEPNSLIYYIKTYLMPSSATWRSGHGLDFCVDSDDNNYGNRRNIRLLSGGVNSSAVYMVEQDDEDKSECIGK